MLIDLLKFNNVDIYTNTSVTMTNGRSVEVKQGDKTFEIPVDTIITSVGYLSNDSLYERIKYLNIPVYNIGDSNGVHNIMYAIWDAYELARNI